MNTTGQYSEAELLALGFHWDLETNWGRHYIKPPFAVMIGKEGQCLWLKHCKVIDTPTDAAALLGEV